MAIEWRLINPQSPAFPGVSRTSRPLNPNPSGVGSGNWPAAIALQSSLNTSAAGAAVVSALGQVLNRMSVNHRIGAELNRLATAAERMLASSPGNGILAVVKVSILPALIGPDAASFHSAFLSTVIATDSRTALQRYRDTPSIESDVPHRSRARLVDLYFWGVQV